MHYLALDPGKSTGWAIFSQEGKPLDRGIRKTDDEVIKLLNTVQPKVVICEDFRLYPWKSKQQSWSRVETTRLIGKIEQWCTEHSAKFILQAPSIKPMAYLWAGLNNKHKHDEDAYVHGIYYLVKNDLRKMSNF